jgi:hypothetical protein
VSLERRDTGPERRDAVPGQVEIRREQRRNGIVASGTLACPVCDAPVAPYGAMPLTASLVCPVCEHIGRVRDFLSLATPTRPAHVVVRLARSTRETAATDRIMGGR